MQPVTIEGSRFYTGGRPYFPTTHFLATSQLLGHSTLRYLARQVSDTDRAQMRAVIAQGGYNTVYLYVLTQNDANRGLVTPYEDEERFIGGAFDEAKLAWWRSELERLIGMGLRPVIFLAGDDSPKVASAPLPELKRHVGKMIEAFDDLPVMWVLGLEADEYWTAAETQELGTYLHALACNPVGIHLLPKSTAYMGQSWVEFGMYQYATSGDWQAIYADTLAKRQAVGNKPLIAAEYVPPGGADAAQMGLAAAFAGAAGLGTGAPGRLDAFMAALPGGMTYARSGDILTMSGGGVRARADMGTLQFTKTGRWWRLLG
jgi:hypothetical protein